MRKIEHAILHKLRSYTLEELGTLKASSSLNEEWYQFEYGKNYSGKKVI
jgi:hypothetical protein